MRQVLIAALLVVAALAATNCTTVTRPSSSANYYMPPKACVENDEAIAGCYVAYGLCVRAAANKTTGQCGKFDECLTAKMRCLEGTTPSDGNCTSWASGLENFGLYLIAGGSYKDSSLEHACQWAACEGASEAFRQNVKDDSGNLCSPVLATLCVTPNFEAPTRAPNQAVYAITFGGDWAALLANAPKNSEAYRKLEAAIQKGLSRLLGVLEYLIAILDMKLGSLIVTFVVNDPNFTVEQITLKLNSLVGNDALVNEMFSELATAAGFSLSVTGVSVEDFSTSAPTETPTEAAAQVSMILAALLAIVAAMMF